MRVAVGRAFCPGLWRFVVLMWFVSLLRPRRTGVGQCVVCRGVVTELRSGDDTGGV